MIFALGLVAREFVVRAAPFLNEDGPVDLCAFHSDCGSDGRGARVEAFERSPFEVFGNGCTPVDDGAEDLSRIRLSIRGGQVWACIEEQRFRLRLLAAGAHISVSYVLS